MVYKSFCQAWVSPGDAAWLKHVCLVWCVEVLYVPPAFSMVEKALLENNIYYRVCTSGMDFRSYVDLRFAKQFFPQTLGQSCKITQRFQGALGLQQWCGVLRSARKSG